MNKIRCPDQICHDKVIRFAFLTKIIGGTVGLLDTILIAATLCINAAENKQDEKIAQIPVIQKDIEHIKVDMKRIADKVDKQMTKKDVVNAVKEAMGK